MTQYGWISDKDSLDWSIRYNPRRVEHFHIFSIKGYGEAFGLNEYDTLIPIKDYMDSPANLIDDLLDGYAIGKRKAKEHAMRLAKSKAGKSLDPEAAIQAKLKEEGLR